MEADKNMTDSQLMDYIFRKSQKHFHLEFKDISFENGSSISDKEIMAHFADIEAEDQFFNDMLKEVPCGSINCKESNFFNDDSAKVFFQLNENERNSCEIEIPDEYELESAMVRFNDQVLQKTLILQKKYE